MSQCVSVRLYLTRCPFSSKVMFMYQELSGFSRCRMKSLCMAQNVKTKQWWQDDRAAWLYARYRHRMSVHLNRGLIKKKGVA